MEIGITWILTIQLTSDLGVVVVGGSGLILSKMMSANAARAL